LCVNDTNFYAFYNNKNKKLHIAQWNRSNYVTACIFVQKLSRDTVEVKGHWRPDP